MLSTLDTMSSRDDSGVPAGRASAARASAGGATATISVAQTAPIRVHHLTETLCEDEPALRRALPPAAEHVLQLTGRRTADAAAIEAALALDPALAASLVSIAATGLFAAGPPVMSVRGAVLQLGLEPTRDIVLLVVTSGIGANLPGHEARAESLHRRAWAAAIAARLVAKSLRVESAHDFLIGLMHDVGELILLQRSCEEGILSPALLDDPIDGPLVLDALEADHTRVGAALCRAWDLPPAVAEAAEHHHHRSGGLPSRLAAAADVIAWHVTGGPVSDPDRQAVFRATLQATFAEIGLSPAAAATIIAEVGATLPALVAAVTSLR